MRAWVFLTLATILCAALFLRGLRIVRGREVRPDGLRVGLSMLSAPPDSRGGGWFFMIFALLFWLFVAAQCFGLLGPVDGIEPITLN